MPSGADRIWNSLGYGCIRPDKVGKDAGELAGGEPLGLAATNDADALIALAPDCVVYAASGPERDGAAVPDYLRLLQAGINVVSTSSTSLVYPPSYFAPDWRDQLEAAAKSGGASFYASGIFPGLRLRSARVAHDHAVEEHPQHHGQRGRAQRPLPGGRRDDGRDGLRPPTGFRTHAQDARASSKWLGRHRYT